MADGKPPWDPQRAAFWLLAFVIGTECLIAVGAMASCLWYAELIIRDPSIKCDADGRMGQLLTAALAAALALWGIRKA